MSAVLQWHGLDELIQELQHLPDDLKEEASRIVQASANAATVAIRSEYGQHRVTGDLQEKVVVRQDTAGPFGVRYIVTSGSRLANIFERGSKLRHYITVNGVQHETGAMWGHGSPPFTVARNAARRRRQMWQELKDLLVRHGATVTGDVP